MKRPVTWARAALDDIKEQIAFIAQDNPAAARRVADRLRDTGAALGDMATGRPGRVTGSYEKSVSRLPYIIAYELRPVAGRESVVILRVIHTSRDWADEDRPH
ncbi:plasmid stabilization system protein ParE [Paracoccus versutus]|uniref:Plasmid stabilization system protein ParE n=1 Tax=Paracoccus versutus TaxID=34007 RepID=A0AAQ0HF86_PARVE|nr:MULTISPECIES: type II toxin-antitoxin system RelE/ParE family toxin [Paracoccus]KGJ12746.1 plasmid stabilization protein [Paracoccus versutus]KRW97227.1 plasmid stabilization protein [Paracoccus sp. MKU1]REG38410.1 plasmid stabilization system protein ParE [Paracoccus versutus]